MRRPSPVRRLRSLRRKAADPAARTAPYHHRVASGDELRTLMRRVPAGIAVVGVDADGTRLAVTVGSFVSLSLDPPLVGVAVGRNLALHELLREAGGFS